MKTLTLAPYIRWFGCVSFALGLATFGWSQGPLPKAAPPPQGKPRFVLETRGHTNWVRALEFSHDSQRLYSAGHDKLVLGWGLREVGRARRRVDATLVQRLRWEISRGMRGVVYTLAASPNTNNPAASRLLALGGYGARGSNGDIIIYDTAQAQVVASLVGHNQPVYALDFSPDGTKLASISTDGELRVWTVGAWQSRVLEQAAGEAYEYLPLAFIDNQSLAAPKQTNPAANIWQVAIYNTDAGGPPSVIRPGHAGAITALRADPRTGRLASADFEGRVFVWQNGVANEARFVRFTQPRALSLDFGPGDTLFAATKLTDGDNPVAYLEMWSVTQGRQLDRAETGYDIDNFACRVSPDGKWAACCGDSSDPVLVFPLTNLALEPLPTPLSNPAPAGEPIRLGGDGVPMGKVAFAEDNSYRLGIGQLTTEIIRKNELGKVEQVFDPRNSDLRPVQQAPGFRPLNIDSLNTANCQANLVGAGLRKFRIDILKDGQLLCHINLDPDTQGAVRSYCWLGNREGTLGIAVGTDHQNGVFIYRLVGNQGACPLIRYYRDHAGWVTSLSVSHDLRYLASASRDQTVKIWSLDGLNNWQGFLEATAGPFRNSGAWGATFVKRPDGVFVTSVLKHGIAAGRGLSDGDKIAEVYFLQNERIVSSQNADVIFREINNTPPTGNVAIRKQGDKDAINIVPAWEPLATLFVDRRGEWAFYTPQGPYDSSTEGDEMFGFQYNVGRENTPLFFRADQFRNELEQPDVLRGLLASGDIEAATRQANRPVTPQLNAQIDAVANLSPVLRILKPEDNAQVAGGNVQVEAVVTYRNQAPAGQFKPIAYINGAPFTNFEVFTEGNQARYRWTIPPTDRFNRLTVEMNEQPQVGPAGDNALDVTFTARPPASKRNLYVWTIAAQEYQGKAVPALSAPVQDADLLTKTLKEACGALYNVKEFAPLRNGDISKSSINQSVAQLLKTLQQEARPQDLLVVLVAGHGLALDGKYYYLPCHPKLALLNGNLNANKQFPPADQAIIKDVGIAWDSLERLSDAPCRKLVLLDTCFAGNAAVEADPTNSRKASQRGFLKKQVLVFSATSENQLAGEDAKGGFFMRYVARGLDGDAVPKTREAKQGVPSVVLIRDLVGYVSENVPFLASQVGKEQEPIVLSSKLLDHMKHIELAEVN